MTSPEESASESPVVTPDLEFVKIFPAGGPSIQDTDEALAARFKATGRLASAVEYIAEHELKAEDPDLGVLTTCFDVRDDSRRTTGVWVAPMGANDDVLLGCLKLPTSPSRGESPLKRGQVVDLFGVAVTVESSRLAYAVLDRNEVGAAGLGFMKYAGKIAAFKELPHDEQLHAFAASVVPGTPEFPMARVDKSVEPVRAFPR